MANKKRSVEFIVERKWIPTNEQKKGEPKYEEIKDHGLFHQWGTEIEEGENEVATETVGIVEDTKGQIHSVPPSWIKFIN